MDLSKYRNKLIGSKEERAVSPVIGVILMVAITVILAAVIAAFVLDMGDSMGDTAPTSNFEWDQNGSSTNVDYVSVSHKGGDALDEGELNVSVTADGGSESDSYSLTSEWAGGDDITAGDTLTVGNSTSSADVVFGTE